MNETFIAFALLLLAGLKTVIDWGDEIERKIEDLASAIRARDGGDPTRQELGADIAASDQAHVTFQNESIRGGA